MNVRTVRVVLVLMMGLTLGLAAQARNIAGKWDIDVNSPHGTIAMGLDLKVDGEAVTGTLLNFRGQDLPIAGTYVKGELNVQTKDEEIAIAAKWRDDGTLIGMLSTTQG